MNMRHEWSAWTEEEERGVLVVTHGPRTGRIYNVEQFTKQRTCVKCQETETSTQSPRPFEWPGTTR